MDVNRMDERFFTGCIFEEGVDYSGNTIHGMANIPVTDQHDCSHLCAAENSCNFWTFQPSDNCCWLKTSDSGKQAYQDLNSGSKACGGTGKIVVVWVVGWMEMFNKLKFNCAQLRITICLELLSVF
jgi:hypothetical protein